MSAPNVNTGRTRPVIALDAAECSEGRALFTISALYWCTDWLPSVDLRFVDLTNEDVALAAEVFRWEHGIDYSIRKSGSGESPLEGADLYAAVAFSSARHLRLHEAYRSGIPTLLAIQFPEPRWLSPAVLCRCPAAFDPRVFASELGGVVKPWL
jgi:hypothetical protein